MALLRFWERSVPSIDASSSPGAPGPSGELRLSAPAPSRSNPFLPSISLRTTPTVAPPLPAFEAPSVVSIAEPAPSRTLSTVPIRAVAVAHETANAVGTVELSCSPSGLIVKFVRISAWTEGFVPYPATVSENVIVPFDQIARVTIDGDGLVHFVFDPFCTPFNRLVLAGLVHEAAFDHRTSYRRRERIERKIGMVALIAWIPIVIGLARLFPSMAPTLDVAFGVTLSGILHTMRREIASRLVLFSAKSELVRDELLAELSLRLPAGRVREQVASAVPAPAASPAELGEPEIPEPGSLRGLFVTAGIVAAAAVVAILVGRGLVAAEPDAAQRAANDESSSTSTEPLAAAQVPSALPCVPIVADAVVTKPVLPGCVCERADSPLWKDGVPRLSVVARDRAKKSSAKKPTVAPEIAIVNNTGDDLKDVVLTVNFFLGGPGDGKVRGSKSKDLFWAGRLAPGRAVKWRVKGRGERFEVKSYVEGLLSDAGTRPAPAEAFWELSTTARTTGVRVHATKMLAYLGDGRTAEALEKLRAEAKVEFGDVMDQIGEAARPVRVCGVKASAAEDGTQALRVEACVFNAGKEAKESPMVTARSQRDGTIRESRWAVETSIAPGTGVLTSGMVPVPEGETDGSAVKVELVVEP